MRREIRSNGAERGFALVLALMALMLLTFLGLAMTTMTSSELQIAVNHRWSQQALYNAEAGAEMGKSLLRAMNWSLIMPAPRRGASGAVCVNPDGLRCWWPYIDMDNNPATTPALPTVAPYSRSDPHGNPSRNFENSTCDTRGNGMGYGVVLDDGGGFGPYQNVTNIQGQSLNGTFTLWVRREFVQNQDGSFSDDPGAPDTRIVLVAEGTAPFPAAGPRIFTQTNRAVRAMEVSLTRTLDAPCGTRGGQVGGGPEGSNFSPCDPITGASLSGALDGNTAGAPRAESVSVQ